MTESPGPVEVQPEMVDLTKKSFKEIAEAEGDTALEKTLERLKEEVVQPREPVSGFASSI